MEKQVLIAIVVIILVGLGCYHLRCMLTEKKGVSLDKGEPAEPPAMIEEGVVMRIGIVSNQWGPTAHILLEDRPSRPITFSFGTDDAAIALTQVGDRVRLEREDADADEYEFRNLTTGLTATSE